MTVIALAGQAIVQAVKARRVLLLHVGIRDRRLLLKRKRKRRCEPTRECRNPAKKSH
jgi:hypothetical protein